MQIPFGLTVTLVTDHSQYAYMTLCPIREIFHMECPNDLFLVPFFLIYM